MDAEHIGVISLALVSMRMKVNGIIPTFNLLTAPKGDLQYAGLAILKRVGLCGIESDEKYLIELENAHLRKLFADAEARRPKRQPSKISFASAASASTQCNIERDI
jgi:hypothetical protein